MAATSEFDKVPDGYAKLAALISKEEDYIIFRRFRNLNARNVLYLQDELIEVERRLEAIDRNLQSAGDKDVLKSRARSYEDTERKGLALELRRLLAEYSK